MAILKKFVLSCLLVVLVMTVGRFCFDKSILFFQVVKQYIEMEQDMLIPDDFDSPKNIYLVNKFELLLSYRYFSNYTLALHFTEDFINRELEEVYRELISIRGLKPENHATLNYYYRIYGNCCRIGQDREGMYQVLESLNDREIFSDKFFINKYRYKLMNQGVRQLVSGSFNRPSLKGNIAESLSFYAVGMMNDRYSMEDGKKPKDFARYIKISAPMIEDLRQYPDDSWQRIQHMKLIENVMILSNWTPYLEYTYKSPKCNNDLDDIVIGFENDVSHALSGVNSNKQVISQAKEAKKWVSGGIGHFRKFKLCGSWGEEIRRQHKL